MFSRMDRHDLLRSLEQGLMGSSPPEGVAYSIEQDANGVLVTAIYDAERGYTDEPWSCLDIPNHSTSGIENSGRGTIYSWVRYLTN